jgi:hypothetical protein
MKEIIKENEEEYLKKVNEHLVNLLAFENKSRFDVHIYIKNLSK